MWRYQRSVAGVVLMRTEEQDRELGDKAGGIYSSVFGRVLALTLLLALLPAAVFEGYTLWKLRGLTRDELLVDARHRVESAAGQVQGRLGRVEAVLAAAELRMVQLGALAGADACDGLFRGLDVESPVMSDVMLLDGAGRIVCRHSSDGLARLEPAEHAAWSETPDAVGAVRVAGPVRRTGTLRGALLLKRQLRLPLGVKRSASVVAATEVVESDSLTVAVAVDMHELLASTRKELDFDREVMSLSRADGIELERFEVSAGEQG